MAKLFFRTCVNTTLLSNFKSAPLWNALVELGGWPLLTYDKNYDSVDFTALLAKIKRLYDIDIFFQVDRTKDIRNGSRNIYYIDQANLGLGAGTRSYYLNDTLYFKQMIAYKKYAVDVINTLSNDFNLRILPETFTELNEIFEFERLLANSTIALDAMQNISSIYNKFTLSDIQTKTPFVNWTLYFQIILPSEVFAFVNQPNFVYIVKYPSYMEKLQNLFASTNKKTLINYMMWLMVKTYSRFLDSRFDDINQEFFKVIYGRKEKPERWKYCLAPLVSSSLDMAVGALYAREYFTEDDKSEATSMIKNLQESFKEMLQQLSWMDDATKTEAISKVDSMLIKVGYPDFIANDTTLDAYYNALQLLPTDSFFEIMRKLYVWHRMVDLRDIMTPFNRIRWDFSPAYVNAQYSPLKNSITFPAAILHPPFFRNDLPKSVIYGAMGSVMGHEITHGFDYTGSQFDKTGLLKNWWTTNVMENFKNKTKCYVNQYGGYVVEDINKNINGRLTLDENIADNGGLKESYNAYRKYIRQNGKEELSLPGLLNLTNDQIFFVSFANYYCGNTKRSQLLQMILTDSHSPDEFRVNGAVSNSDEFAKTFNCPVGTNMNPNTSVRQKCDLW